MSESSFLRGVQNWNEFCALVALILTRAVEQRSRGEYAKCSGQFGGKFIEKLIDKLNEVAVENKLTGGVWTTVGPADAKGPWTDDGRIGQYDLIRIGVVNLGIARSSANGFVALCEKELIQFPPKFNVAISRVIRLSATGEEVARAPRKLK